MSDVPSAQSDPGTYDAYHAVAKRLFQVAARMQNLRRTIAKSIGMSSQEWAILLSLEESARPPISINELAKMLAVSASNVTAAVARLEEQALVTKARSVEDARTLELTLAPGGRALLAQMEPALAAINSAWFKGADANDCAAATRVLDTLIARYEQSERVARLLGNPLERP